MSKHYNTLPDTKKTDSDNTVCNELISVIIPIYKVEAFIRPCLESLMAQTYKQLEVILVDDCGGDASVEIAGSMLESSGYTWQVVTHARNRGLSAARNSGAEVARGQYLFFLDSDDYLSPDAIQLLLTAARTHHAEMVFGNLEYDTDGELTPCLWTRHEPVASDIDPVAAHVRRWAFPMAWNRLIDRSFYQRCGVTFIEGLLHEDEPWAFSLIIRATRIAFVQKITYYYRQRGGAITSAKRSGLPRLLGMFAGFKSISDEAEQFALHSRPDFQQWFQNNILNYLSAIHEGNATPNDKKQLLRKVMTELKLPAMLLKDNKLFRLARCFEGILPYNQWIGLYLGLRKLQKNTRAAQTAQC